jgi:predicted O-methyltransferase YrrM
MKTFEKIMQGDVLRKTRFHDEKGNRISWKQAWRNGGRALWSSLARHYFDYRPTLPWICYEGIGYLEARLSSKSRVLEFGSGMSTVWYSRHAKEVCSVEDYRPWYEKVQNLLRKDGIPNVIYRFAESPDSYANFMQKDKEGFDLIMVDGSHRSRCITQSVALLRRGGILFLDDSDKDIAKGGDMREAERLLRYLAEQKKARIREFTDFSPTQFFVKQGIAMELPD